MEGEKMKIVATSGGGGGSRTRVRKHLARKVYVRVRFVIFSRCSIGNQQDC